MHPIPAMSMVSGELASTGVTILPMIITAVALLSAGLVLIRVFSRRDR